MTKRRPSLKSISLTAEDEALWQSVTREVSPLDRPRSSGARAQTHNIDIRRRETRVDVDPRRSAQAAPQSLRQQPLDTSWQKRLRRGRMEVDQSVDLHGMTQIAAHRLLMQTLERAMLQGQRIILVVTGKGQPKTTSPFERGDRPRGVLRQKLPQWVEESPFAPHVFAIRPAHPTHGGKGAYYILMRRRRDG